MNIKNTLLAAALAGSGALGAVSAQAMPLAPVSGAAPMIEYVAMGCGRGWTRDAFGRCVPMVVRPMYVRPRVYVRPVYPAPRRYYYRRYW
ncbi:MAG: hypothetical protein U1E28_14330 [Beijerinckiaceae bacterium]